MQSVGLMDILFVVVHVSLCVWLIFFDGAERLKNSFSTVLFFYPGMTERELKFYAALSLLLVPIYFFI